MKSWHELLVLYASNNQLNNSDTQYIKDLYIKQHCLDIINNPSILKATLDKYYRYKYSHNIMLCVNTVLLRLHSRLIDVESKSYAILRNYYSNLELAKLFKKRTTYRKLLHSLLRTKKILLSSEDIDKLFNDYIQIKVDYLLDYAKSFNNLNYHILEKPIKEYLAVETANISLENLISRTIIDDAKCKSILRSHMSVIELVKLKLWN